MAAFQAVYGLTCDLKVAEKITQIAQNWSLEIRHFDRAEKLLQRAAERLPNLFIIDWDHCEAEAFKLLSSRNDIPALKKVPVIGYLSNEKGSVKEEAERAGCMRVWLKTEFMNDLEDIMIRSMK